MPSTRLKRVHPEAIDPNAAPIDERLGSGVHIVCDVQEAVGGGIQDDFKACGHCHAEALRTLASRYALHAGVVHPAVEAYTACEPSDVERLLPHRRGLHDREGVD